MTRTPDARNYFVVGEYGPAHFSPVHLNAYTLEQAKRAKAWQGVGGPTPFHICRPHPTKRAVFVPIDSDLELEAAGGGWTAEAWSSFIARTWPKAEG